MIKIKSFLVTILAFIVGAGTGLFFAMPENLKLAKDSYEGTSQRRITEEGLQRKEIQRYAVSLDTMEPSLRVQPSNMAALSYVQDKLMQNLDIEDLRKLTQEVLDEYDWDFIYSQRGLYNFDNSERIQCVEMILDKWMKLAPLSAFEFMTEKGTRFQEDDLYEAWSKCDPESAMRDLEERMERGIHSWEYSSMIISNWSALSPDAAWKWLLNDRIGDHTEGHYLDFFRSVLEYQPQKVMEFAHQAKKSFISALTQQEEGNRNFDLWFVENPDELEKWVEGLSEEEKRQFEPYRMRLSAMKDLSGFMEELKKEGSFEEQIELPSFDYLELKKRGEKRSVILDYIINYNKAFEAPSWGMDSDFIEIHSLNEAVLENRDIAMDMLKKVPVGSRRDCLLESIIETDNSDNNAGKLKLAEEINDVGKRVRVKDDILEKWELLSPSEVEKWRKENGEPE